jgi:hypothetical protein
LTLLSAAFRAEQQRHERSHEKAQSSQYCPGGETATGPEPIDGFARLAKREPETADYIQAQAPTFSDQLREALRVTGLSLKDLARRTRIDNGRLFRFLRGERSLTLESSPRSARKSN